MLADEQQNRNAIAKRNSHHVLFTIVRGMQRPALDLNTRSANPMVVKQIQALILE